MLDNSGSRGRCRDAVGRGSTDTAAETQVEIALHIYGAATRANTVRMASAATADLPSSTESAVSVTQAS